MVCRPLRQCSCAGIIPCTAFPVGFFIFSFIINPNLACIQLFSVPYNVFVFCCWRRSLSRCSTRAKVHRSQVSSPGRSHWWCGHVSHPRFPSGPVESIRLSHGAGGLHTFLPFHTVSARQIHFSEPWIPSLSHLPQKFWTFCFMPGGPGLSPGFQDPSQWEISSISLALLSPVTP